MNNRINAGRRRFLQEKIDELQETILHSQAGGSTVNDAQKELEKYLKEFLMIGINANHISGLLSYKKRLKHRSLLTKYGARIQIKALNS